MAFKITEQQIYKFIAFLTSTGVICLSIFIYHQFLEMNEIKELLNMQMEVISHLQTHQENIKELTNSMTNTPASTIVLTSDNDSWQMNLLKIIVVSLTMSLVKSWVNDLILQTVDRMNFIKYLPEFVQNVIIKTDTVKFSGSLFNVPVQGELQIRDEKLVSFLIKEKSSTGDYMDIQEFIHRMTVNVSEEDLKNIAKGVGTAFLAG